MKLQSQIVI